MKIPVSDALLDNSSAETVSVPLAPDEMEWLTDQAEVRDLSKRQFVRYIINRMIRAERKRDGARDAA
jgi:hypothetical protein